MTGPSVSSFRSMSATSWWDWSGCIGAGSTGAPRHGTPSTAFSRTCAGVASGWDLPMADLTFECVDIRPDRYGTSPTLLLKLRITEGSANRIHAIALRIQLRIEPQRRRYGPHE